MNRLIALLCLAAFAANVPAQTKGEFVKKESREATIRATLKANGFPTLEGPWHWIGPFDNTGKIGFDKEYPPEKAIDLKKTYLGKGEKEIGWKEMKTLPLGKIFDLTTLIKPSQDTVIYLYHEIELAGEEPALMPLLLGSDDTISVWLNGKRLLHEDVERPAAPDQNKCELALRPGKNQLLLKITNVGGGFEVYVQPEFPKSMPAAIVKQLDKVYPKTNSNPSTGTVANSAEAKYYRIVTLEPPPECILEVGGLAFRPDGKLLATTRRGEVWLITNPNAEDPRDIKWQRFATGMHEVLGIHVEDNNTIYVTQRPELTKIVDKNGDGKADEYTTICDKWGCSGDYHEYAFGLPRDKEGNFYVTLNVGFGGGHQAKSPWRGWCVKITPKGEMEPIAWGLRSPNGVVISPDGDLFYCDNQGEWVATNKMHQIIKGEFYGHQAGLVWLKETPFIKTHSDKVLSGMLYDGQKGDGANAPSGFPELTPPVIWFPYGRMGQSVSEPRWDTTGGKFGPFAGQVFVGDQNKSIVMRVALEKVNGKYQGACFPFRSGFQCGVNRLLFGDDGSLYVGETDRGWGSVAKRPFGLQRLVYTGELPFEIQTMKLTKSGFDLTFTKPIDSDTAKKLENFTLKSFTYMYFSNYGCPEKDTKVETIKGIKISDDRKSASLEVGNLRRGRIYDLHIDGVKAGDGDSLLHADAWYTLNHLVQ